MTRNQDHHDRLVCLSDALLDLAAERFPRIRPLERSYEMSDETNLDSLALAADLIQQGHAALMDCDTHRVAAMAVDATQDMRPDDFRRLIHQMAWIGGTLAALLPDDQRQATLAGFVHMKVGQP